MKSKRGIGLIALIIIIVLILIGGGTTIFFLTKTSNREKNIQETNNVALNESNVEISKLEVPDEYIGIYTANDFLKFNTQEYSLDGKYILMNNIDLSSIQEFIPIGYYEGSLYPKKFTGVFDGNCHTISNLNLKSSKELEGNIGLFNEIEAGTIKNLNIKNAKIIIEQENNSVMNIGLLAGKIENSLIENCNFRNIKFNINGTESLGGVGTIAGEINGSDGFYSGPRYDGYQEKDEDSNPELTVVRNINVDVELTGNHASELTEFGGAFGKTLTDCGLGIKLENIIINLKSDNENISTSGFASLLNGAEIKKCGANVDINSRNAIANGFAFNMSQCVIDQCYTKGSIIADDVAAGFVAYETRALSYSFNSITNSYSTVNITFVNSNPLGANFMLLSKGLMNNIYASGTIRHINGNEIKRSFIYQFGDFDNGYYNENEINSSLLGLEDIKEDNSFIGLTEDEMKNKDSYKSFDFENIWSIDQNKSTPYLKFEKK